jgi:hypothetical protein
MTGLHMTVGFRKCVSTLAVYAFAVSAGAGLLIAADNADNEPYPLGWNPGDNGGTGFTAWVSLEVGSPGSMYVENMAPLDGTYSWGLSGTYAVGRGLSNSLAEGQWTLLARHGAGVNAFCGFNLRTSTNITAFDTDEILRFGINYSAESDATRIYFSTNRGADYAYIDLGEDDLRGADLEYQVSWSTISGSFTLGIWNGTNYGEITAALPVGGAVAMLGAGVFEATLDERMTFDDYHISAIPEAAVLAYVVLGCGLVRWFASRKGTFSGVVRKPRRGTFVEKH